MARLVAVIAAIGAPWEAWASDFELTISNAVELEPANNSNELVDGANPAHGIAHDAAALRGATAAPQRDLSFVSHTTRYTTRSISQTCPANHQLTRNVPGVNDGLPETLRWCRECTQPAAEDGLQAGTSLIANFETGFCVPDSERTSGVEGWERYTETGLPANGYSAENRFVIRRRENFFNATSDTCPFGFQPDRMGFCVRTVAEPMACPPGFSVNVQGVESPAVRWPAGLCEYSDTLNYASPPKIGDCDFNRTLVQEGIFNNTCYNCRHEPGAVLEKITMDTYYSRMYGRPMCVYQRDPNP